MLRWCDVDLKGRVVTISRSVAKGAGGGATVRQTKTGVVGQTAISEQVVAVLEAVRVRREDAVTAAGEALRDAAYTGRRIFAARARFGRVRDDLGLGHGQLSPSSALRGHAVAVCWSRRSLGAFVTPVRP